MSGERMVPPIIAAMPIIAQRPTSPTGSHWPMTAPIAPPMISNGARTPPEVPEPSAIDQTSAFADQQDRATPRRKFRRASKTVNHFVTDAEHARIDPSADADEEGADGRPPHPVKRQLRKSVFEKINKRGQQARAEPGGDADPARQQPLARDQVRVRARSEKWARRRATESGVSQAPTAATTTGMKLRGRHSKSSSSTASKVAAMGAANTADIPPAAPATSRVLRSAAVR